jgi:hypothetical protein
VMTYISGTYCSSRFAAMAYYVSRGRLLPQWSEKRGCVSVESVGLRVIFHDQTQPLEVCLFLALQRRSFSLNHYEGDLMWL